jgi:hypothetical protein
VTNLPASGERLGLADTRETQLRKFIQHHFEELETLCFDMGIDYATLPAQGKTGKARELVAHCRRHGRSSSG